MKKEKVTKIINYISLGLVIAISVGYAVLEGIGFDVQWMFSILLGMLAVYFLTNGIIEDSNVKENKKVETNLVELSEQLKQLNGKFETPLSYALEKLSTQKIVLDSIDDIDAYLADKIAKAEMSVFDLCWWDYSGDPPAHRSRITQQNLGQRIDEAIYNFCQKENVEYREIFTMHSQSNKNKMLKHIRYGKNYKCSYFDNSKYKFPKIQFVILDDKEVVFASRFYGKHCIINDKDLVDIMLNYFDQAWALSIKIKDDGVDNLKFIEKITAELNEQQNAS